MSARLLCDIDAETLACAKCLLPAPHAGFARRCSGRPHAFTVQQATTPKCKAGSALKSLLASLGLDAGEGCKCRDRAAHMDAAGCDWCAAHLDEIVGWLREEATKRGLPFLDAAGRVLVRRAISNARKEQARGTERPPLPPQR